MEFPGGALWLPVAVLSVIGFILAVCDYEHGYADDGLALNSTYEILSEHYATNLVKIMDGWVVRQREFDLGAHSFFFCWLMIMASLQTKWGYSAQIWVCFVSIARSLLVMGIYGSVLRICILVIWILLFLLAIMNKCISSVPEPRYMPVLTDYVVQLCEQIRLEDFPRQAKQPRVVTGDDVLKLV